jgi:hypothetical protein
MYEASPVVLNREAIVRALFSMRTPPWYVPGARRIVSPLAAAATAACRVGWSPGTLIVVAV